MKTVLLRELSGLAPHERTELVALMWVGRGDADPDEWAETLQLAGRRRSTGPQCPQILAHGIDDLINLASESHGGPEREYARLLGDFRMSKSG